MAEALLGLEFDIHGGGIDLVFPHHENEIGPDGGRPRPPARAAVDAQRHARGLRGREDGQVGRQHPRAGRGARRRRAARRWSCTSAPATTASRWPSRRSRWRRRATRCGGSARRARRLAPGESPDELAVAPRRVLRRAGRRLQHRQALPALYEWIGEANKLPEGTGDADLREMLGVLGLESLLRGRGGPAAGGRRARRAPRARPATAKDWAEADRLRDELREHGLGGARRPAGTGARPGVLTAAAAGRARERAARPRRDDRGDRPPRDESRRRRPTLPAAARRARSSTAATRCARRCAAAGSVHRDLGDRGGARRGVGGRAAGDRRGRRDRAALRLRRPPGRLRRGRPVPVRRRRRAARRGPTR